VGLHAAALEAEAPMRGRGVVEGLRLCGERRAGQDGRGKKMDVFDDVLPVNGSDSVRKLSRVREWMSW
jgi:hypothetical protein